VNDRGWLLAAIELSRHSPVVTSAYAVGAIVVDATGRELASGYSRDVDPYAHAEESALTRLAATGAGPTVLAGATVYTSMEPCSVRTSRPMTCTQLILASGIRRVVFALYEPPLLADCHGVELLRAGGVEVVEVPDLADDVRAVNAALLATASRLTRRADEL